MRKRSATANRILEVARTTFNHNGYVASSVKEIAQTLGMSQGNLTYHFPAKSDLAMTLENDLLQIMKERRNKLVPGPLAEDYIEHLLFGMELTWRYRFVMRDRRHYAGDPIGKRPDSELIADFHELKKLLNRIKSEEAFVKNTNLPIDVLAKSLWIVSRYWIDHLFELEGLEEVKWADQERGIQHHLAILLPNLKASAQRDFETALQNASNIRRMKDAAKPSFFPQIEFETAAS